MAYVSLHGSPELIMELALGKVQQSLCDPESIQPFRHEVITELFWSRCRVQTHFRGTSGLAD